MRRRSSRGLCLDASRRAPKLLAELALDEPGGECTGQPARTDQPDVAGADELAEGREAGEPSIHLPGVALDDEVDILALILLADGHAVAVDVEPALGPAD